MLGKYKKNRKLSIVEFKDSAKCKCSLQQSSAAISEDGNDFLWLGINTPEEFPISTRMHLNREQVQGLVERLQQWLKTGDFEQGKTQ